MIELVALWAFAEALLWFVVADVPISAVGLRHGFLRAAGTALVAALAAAWGGQVMLRWAMAAPEASRAALDHVPGIDAGLIDRAAEGLRTGGFAAMLAGSFTGVPYKLYAHAAGLSHAAPIHFFLLSVAARLPRFLLVSTISGVLRPLLRRHLSPRQIVLAFIAFWMLFYFAYFVSLGGVN